LGTPCTFWVAGGLVFFGYTPRVLHLFYIISSLYVFSVSTYGTKHFYKAHDFDRLVSAHKRVPEGHIYWHMLGYVYRLGFER